MLASRKSCPNTCPPTTRSACLLGMRPSFIGRGRCARSVVAHRVSQPRPATGQDVAGSADGGDQLVTSLALLLQEGSERLGVETGAIQRDPGVAGLLEVGPNLRDGTLND